MDLHYDNKQIKFSTSTASDRMKNAINTKNSPFTKPASTSALPYLFIKMKLKYIILQIGEKSTLFRQIASHFPFYPLSAIYINCSQQKQGNRHFIEQVSCFYFRQLLSNVT